MTSKDHDTDPSTPSARRSGPPPRAAPSTDPGVGPQGQRRSPSGRPLGVVVPPATPHGPAVPAEARAVAKKDSVELLLDGMSGPRPDRTKTTPQTGGEASAAYHAEHSVHPGHRPNDDAPKVLVDRPSTPRAIPLSAAQAAARRAPTVTGLSPVRDLRADPTFVTPRDLKRRILLAAIAGVGVVLALFFVLTLLSSRQGVDIPVLASHSPRAAETSARVTATEPPAAPQAAVEHEVLSPAAAPVEPTPPPTAAAEAPAPSPARSLVPAPAQAAPARKHRPRATTAPAPSASASDLGEFKTTF